MDEKQIKKMLKELSPEDTATLKNALGVKEGNDPDVIETLNALTLRIDQLEKKKPDDPKPADPVKKKSALDSFFSALKGE